MTTQEIILILVVYALKIFNKKIAFKIITYLCFVKQRLDNSVLEESNSMLHFFYGKILIQILIFCEVLEDYIDIIKADIFKILIGISKYQ